jgi:predicted TIM-barrel enzyme
VNTSADTCSTEAARRGPNIYAVIHYLDDETALQQAAIAAQAGATGVFLIAHGDPADDDHLPMLAVDIKQIWPSLKVGLNLLSRRAVDALNVTMRSKLDMVWLDRPGVSSTGLTQDGERAWQITRAAATATPRHSFELFASIAFKYQPIERSPGIAAKLTRAAGWIPTTSGLATGEPPSLEKLRLMRETSSQRLANASGITPDNIGLYKHALTDILVSTGVSIDEYHFCPSKLRALVDAAHG